MGPEGAAEGRRRYMLAKAGARVRPKAPGRRAGAKGRLSEAAPAERVRCRLAEAGRPKGRRRCRLAEAAGRLGLTEAAEPAGRRLA